MGCCCRWPRFTPLIRLRHGMSLKGPHHSKRATDKSPSQRLMALDLVLRTGFEPATSAVKGRHPKPLDDRSNREMRLNPIPGDPARGPFARTGKEAGLEQ